MQQDYENSKKLKKSVSILCYYIYICIFSVAYLNSTKKCFVINKCVCRISRRKNAEYVQA